MKRLLDENLSRRLVPFLQHDYPDSSQVVPLGMESATLKVLLENREIITESLLERDLASVEVVPV